MGRILECSRRWEIAAGVRQTDASPVAGKKLGAVSA